MSSTTAANGGAAVLLVAFVANERSRTDPLVPLSIFGIRGLAAANLTHLVIAAGMLSMFFFVTLHMQTVLGYGEFESGLAYLPGVPADHAGLAAALLNTGQQLDGALGLAVLTAVATSHTNAR